MTVVWRSFLEIYETFQKTNCSELSRPPGGWEDQSWALPEHKAVWQSLLLLDSGLPAARPIRGSELPGWQEAG